MSSFDGGHQAQMFQNGRIKFYRLPRDFLEQFG
jgi:hypothetical protein